MRGEDIAWDRGMIFIPKLRPHVPGASFRWSERVTRALHLRREGRAEGWVFPSDSKSGHFTSPSLRRREDIEDHCALQCPPYVSQRR